MSCTLKEQFKQEFGIDLQNGRLIPELMKAKVSSWIYNNASVMKEMSFNDEVLGIEYRKSNSEHAGTDYFIKYDEKAEEQWEAYKYHQASQDALESTQETLNFNENYNYAPDENHEDDNVQGDYLFEDIDVVDSPVNFIEWKNNRKALKEKLEKQAIQYRKHNNDRRKLKLVNKAIAEIDKQLTKFNENDMFIVHETLMQEINVLDKLLKDITTNPVDAAVILESNRIKERINELSVYFNGVDLMNNHSPVNDSLRELLENTFEKDKLYDVQKGISNLFEQYNQNLFTIIESTFANDSLVMEHKKNMSPEEFEKYYTKTIELIKNKEVYIGENQSKAPIFLGAASVDSVLADLLFSGRENYYNQEVGQTQILIQNFTDSWKKIKDKVDANKDYITTQLYQKDKLGVRTNKLISPFTTAFYKLLKDVNSAKFAFFSNKSLQSYKTWMNILKNNADFIQPYKLKVYQELYKDNAMFKSFFTYSEQEMLDYENELKSKLGVALYEIELNKQQEMIKNYINEQENGLFSSASFIYSKNPFSFINNFYSDNFNKPDNVTSEYLEPAYTQMIPKMDKTDEYNPEEYYNTELKKMESGEFGQELMNVYKHAYHLLTEYINPSLQAEGVNVTLMETMNQVDILDREIIKNLSFFQKIPLQFKNLWNSILENYTTNNNMETSKDAFKSKYSSYGKNKTKILQQIYNEKSQADLINLLGKEGIDTNSSAVVKASKRQLVNSLVQLELNKYSSTNLFNSITESTEIVRNMNARKNTMNMFDLFKDYVKNKDKENEIEYEYLNDWGRLNLQKEKYLENNPDPKIIHKNITKTYFNFDRNIKKLLELEKENLKFNYNFKLGEDTYTTDNGIFYKNEQEISKEEIDRQYDEYTKELLSHLGVDYTLGSFANGLLAGIYKSAMRTLAPARYFLNRFAGLNQNMSAAASKEFGFDMKNLLISRRFLRGDILRKMTNWDSARKLLGLQETNRLKNMKTLLSLAESLRILETSMETVKQEGEFGNKGLLKKIDTILTNTAVNYPEWKNQMEGLLSILQTVEIETINGEKKKVFDGNNFIYIPGTLQLKDEFRTEANVENWEKFKEDTDGNSPQNLIFALSKQAKRKTQGNYSGEDKVPVLGSEIGKLGSVFTRYLYENTNRQYGSKKSDLATGQLDVKGNKLILVEHAPTFLTHLVLGNGWVNTLGGMVIGTSALSAGAFVSTAAIVPTLIIGAMVIANRKVIKMNHLNKDEMRLALNYAKETALRSINIIPNYLQLSLIPEDKINAIKFIPSGMTAKERDILSASAQELSQKMGMFIGSAMTSLILSGIYSLLSVNDDDEEKKEKMAALEMKLNTLINLKNSLYSDIEKYTNPLEFKDASTTLIYVKMLERNWKKMNKAIDNYGTDKIEEGELTSELTKALGFLVGLPKAVNEISEPGTLVNTERIYEKGDWFDELIDNKTKPAEQNYKDATQELREPIRNKLVNQIRDAYQDSGKEMSEETIKELATAWLRQHDLTKDKGETYESLFNDKKKWNDAEKEIDKINSSNVHQIQKTKRKQSKSDSASSVAK